MILLTIGLLLIILVAALLMNYSKKDWEVTAGITIFVAAIGLLMVALAWPISYYDELDNVRKYYSVRDTIEEARKSNVSDIERAALVTQIVEVNVWLAQVQHRNHRFFSDDTIPDEVDQLVPLK